MVPIPFFFEEGSGGLLVIIISLIFSNLNLEKQFVVLHNDVGDDIGHT